MRGWAKRPGHGTAWWSIAGGRGRELGVSNRCAGIGRVSGVVFSSRPPIIRLRPGGRVAPERKSAETWKPGGGGVLGPEGCVPPRGARARSWGRGLGVGRNFTGHSKVRSEGIWLWLPTWKNSGLVILGRKPNRRPVGATGGLQSAGRVFFSRRGPGTGGVLGRGAPQITPGGRGTAHALTRRSHRGGGLARSWAGGEGTPTGRFGPRSIPSRSIFTGKWPRCELAPHRGLG